MTRNEWDILIDAYHIGGENKAVRTGDSPSRGGEAAKAVC